MKILLVAINSKFIHTNPAVYSLKAYAEKENPSDICISEYTINQRMEEILMDIYKQKPQVIGFSCYIWNWQMVQELLTELPKLLPDTDIYLGGPEVSYEADQILVDYPMLSGIMLGEGEETFKELVSVYQKNEQYKGKIAGILYPDGTCQIREMLDFDSIPFLYDSLKEFDHKIIYYESSRGCPYRCSYCLSSIEKQVRFRSIEKVQRELQFFLDQRVPQVKFIDRTFNCDNIRAAKIWRYLIEHDNGITNFHFEVAAEQITEEELCLFEQMRPGLIQLEIGVQSTNQDTLREIQRKADFDHLARVVRRIRSGNNIHVHLDLIAGLPKEDYVSFVHSFNQVYSLEPEQLQLGFLKVLKGTRMEENKEAYGLFYQSRPPYEVLYTNWISYDEICKLKQIEEMVELYYNSNQFTHTLPMLVEAAGSPFAFYERLAAYYEKKGFYIYTPQRGAKYDILLSFAGELIPEGIELVQERLTYDYYLRENAKSRPAFCKNIQEYYDRIWSFYIEEEKEPNYLVNYRQYHAKQTMKMTHMEVFRYPVWQEGNPLPAEADCYVLFDYERRNPLTGEAYTILLNHIL